MRISDLRNREIVNLSDGRKLGIFDDLEIDTSKGVVKALIITGSSGFLGFFQQEQDSIIPWGKVVKIGQDVIIADLSSKGEKTFNKSEE